MFSNNYLTKALLNNCSTLSPSNLNTIVAAILKNDRLNFDSYLHVSECPYCHSKHIVKNGRSKALTQRYVCKHCGHSFTSTKGTIFFSSKKPLCTWRRFVESMYHENSLESISTTVGIGTKTANRWRKKVFKLLENYQDTVEFEGILNIDETFVRTTDIIKQYRINSTEEDKIEILVAVDSEYNAVIKRVGTWGLNAATLIDILGNKVKNVKKIIGDGAYSHKTFGKAVGIPTETYKACKGEGAKELRFVNIVCSQIKRALSRHVGMKSSNLDNYLNWISFRWKFLKIKKKKKRLEELFKSISYLRYNVAPKAPLRYINTI